LKHFCVLHTVCRLCQSLTCLLVLKRLHENWFYLDLGILRWS
jgi:hypothetical protein